MLKLILTLLLSANAAIAKPLAYSVKLETDMSVGSAWITKSKVFGKEVLVSNAHVCIWHKDIKSLSAQGLKDITVIYMRPETDICVMDFSYDGKKLYKVLKLSKTILIPQKVRSDGFPGGDHKITKHKTIAIIGTTHPIFNTPIVSWIYEPSQPPGISGSPVLNSKNEVVGMIWGVNPQLDYNLGVSLTEMRVILEGEY